ncbi:lysozyme-like [Ostrinia furnacalis]|uniref:lysozyme-like n=1 Tax=Ostrinia furnacalis TaxID=93504 RepID=UPI00103BFE32|nr:lysozyme-like [Ostrinia furnacalis]
MRIKVLIVLAVMVLSEGRKFTRCQLAMELLKTRIIEKTFLGNWVCLIEKVSNRDTKAFTVTPSGKKSYGLYQIPQKWCREGKPGGGCKVSCESLLDDDIRDATRCANHIFQMEGFKYWTQWTARCKNNDMITKEIYKCPDLNSPRSSPERSARLSDSTLHYRLRRRRSIRQLIMLKNRAILEDLVV